MNDLKTLFGGMAGGVCLLAAYIVLWGMAAKCFGGEVISLPLDNRTPFLGDSIEIVDVFGDGIVEKERCVVMREGTWTNLVQRIRRLEAVANKVWGIYNSTADGRRKMHGEVVKTMTDTTNLVKCVLYSDGYTHYEKMRPVRAGRKVSSAKKPSFGRRVTPVRRDIPRGLQEVKKAREEREPVTVSVTIRANAAQKPSEKGGAK